MQDLQGRGLTCNTVAKTAGALALFGHVGVLGEWCMHAYLIFYRLSVACVVMDGGGSPRADDDLRWLI